MEHNNLQLQVGVKALIFNNKNQVLVIKRNLVKYRTVNNPWDIPGGRINLGCSLNENLKREIFEEVCLSRIEILALVSAQDIIKPDKHVIRLTYVARETEVEEIKLSNEHTEFRWLSFDDVEKLEGVDSHVRKIIKDKDTMSLIKTYINKG